MKVRKIAAGLVAGAALISAGGGLAFASPNDPNDVSVTDTADEAKAREDAAGDAWEAAAKADADSKNWDTETAEEGKAREDAAADAWEAAANEALKKENDPGTTDPKKDDTTKVDPKVDPKDDDQQKDKPADKTDTPKVEDGQKGETPKAEAPKVEDKKADAPKAEVKKDNAGKETAKKAEGKTLANSGAETGMLAGAALLLALAGGSFVMYRKFAR